MPQPIKRKKLYFDVSFIQGASGVTMAAVETRVFPCTQFRANYTGGDRYGALLEDYRALTGGSPREEKRKREVAAWFQPLGGRRIGDDSDASNIRTSPTFIGQVRVDFVNATTNPDAADPLLYYTAGGSEVLDKCGATPIFTRHFGVRIQRFGLAGQGIGGPSSPATVFTTHGVVYVQRQHSIEI